MKLVDIQVNFKLAPPADYNKAFQTFILNLATGSAAIPMEELPAFNAKVRTLIVKEWRKWVGRPDVPMTIKNSMVLLHGSSNPAAMLTYTVNELTNDLSYLEHAFPTDQEITPC